MDKIAKHFDTQSVIWSRKPVQSFKTIAVVWMGYYYTVAAAAAAAAAAEDF